MPTVFPGQLPGSKVLRCRVGHQAEKKQQVLSCSNHLHLKFFNCHFLLEISSWIPPPATGKEAKDISFKKKKKKKPEVCHVPIRLIAAMISQLHRLNFNRKDWECLTGGLLTAPG